jgi:hypothetical protein
VLHNLIDVLSPSAASNQLSLGLNFQPEGVNILLGDTHRLGQGFYNLIGNAIKFTSADSIDLAVTVLAQRPGHINLHFAVRDTGTARGSGNISADRVAALAGALEGARRSTNPSLIEPCLVELAAALGALIAGMPTKVNGLVSIVEPDHAQDMSLDALGGIEAFITSLAGGEHGCIPSFSGPAPRIGGASRRG